MKVSYAALDADGKAAIEQRLQIRLNNFLDATHDPRWFPGRVLIVGDRPGPSAPKDAGYHHTPFYSTKHCSGWLNTALHLANIPEDKLIWINSADQNGVPTPYAILDRLEPDIVICLGGNAEKWYQKSWEVPELEYYRSYYKFDHPQYHKRFKNSEQYLLIEFLEDHFGLRPYGDDEYF